MNTGKGNNSVLLISSSTSGTYGSPNHISKKSEPPSCTLVRYIWFASAVRVNRSHKVPCRPFQQACSNRPCLIYPEINPWWCRLSAFGGWTWLDVLSAASLSASHKRSVSLLHKYFMIETGQHFINQFTMFAKPICTVIRLHGPAFNIRPSVSTPKKCVRKLGQVLYSPRQYLPMALILKCQPLQPGPWVESPCPWPYCSGRR